MISSTTRSKDDAFGGDLRRASATLSYTFKTKGAYEYLCTVPGHAAAGMKGKIGVGKLALYGREYLVAIQPRENGLVMYTLRHANEIRRMDAIDELSDMPATMKPVN